MELEHNCRSLEWQVVTGTKVFLSLDQASLKVAELAGLANRQVKATAHYDGFGAS